MFYNIDCHCFPIFYFNILMFANLRVSEHNINYIGRPTLFKNIEFKNPNKAGHQKSCGMGHLPTNVGC